ncbi:MAG: PolC-type DNA polymerase III [Eubacterium sp.]|nr:PolC-type DNA polymerase III [Eubacterium sp.]
MEAFFSVFSNLKCNNTLKNEYGDVVVDKIVASKEKKIVYIYCRKDHLLSYSRIEAMERELFRQVFKSMNIKPNIYLKYTGYERQTVEDIVGKIGKQMVEELKDINVVAANFFFKYPYKVTDNKITLVAEESFLSRSYMEEFKATITMYFKNHFDLKPEVEFEFVERKEVGEWEPEVYHIEYLPRAKTAEEIKQEKAERKKNKKSGADGAGAGADKGGGGEKPAKEKAGGFKSAGNGGGYAKRKSYNRVPKDPDLIYGNNCEGNVVKIIDIQDDIGEVVIEGQVLEFEERQIKSGNYIIILAVTDFTDTIRVKFFVKQAIMEEGELKTMLSTGNFLRFKGVARHDDFDHTLAINNVMGIKEIKDFRVKREDKAKVKRVELHAHTKMSDMDGITPIGELVKRAHDWGHKAVAITDHGVVQAFPEANHAFEDLGLDEDDDFKVIYGCEIYLVDDIYNPAVFNPKSQSLMDEFVVFDLETTGFSEANDKIIEIGAVKIKNGKIVSRFSEFVNPEINIPDHITKLTSITEDMVKDAETIETMLPKFLEFIGDAVLVAHNAGFDHGFIVEKAKQQGIDTDFTVVDTVNVARYLIPDLGKATLDNVAKKLKVSLGHHHRAVDDAEATAGIFEKMISMLGDMGIDNLDILKEKTDNSEEIVKKKHPNHCIVLVKNEIGRVNLYRLVSLAHLQYFHRHPRIPKSLLQKYREGLIIGSACEAGELYSALLRDEPQRRIKELCEFYDYLEIQPVDNNLFMIESERIESVNSVEDIRDYNRRIVELGEIYNKPVVATCDLHFLDPEDNIYRKIILAGKKMRDVDTQPPLYMRTTDEMLEEFSYLGEEKAFEVVVTNTNKIADEIERISPVYPDKCPPVIENSDETLKEICYNKAKSMYGEVLPEIVKERLDRELNSIISNGFAVMYIIAQKLVWKSNEDGYLVGSRGSVGSSFVATMSGITEVNPLPAHYYCKECHYSDFDSEEVKAFSGSSGSDMPPKKCPNCGAELERDGHDIPFETFLGFYGNKEPDIDLNFSGEYQSKAHAYTEVIFGAGQTFRAGTIAGVAEKTAYGFVKHYFEERETPKRHEEIMRLSKGCEGIRRSTGQHPGGIIVLPLGNEIYTFTPVQHPANDMNTPIITTHFDYHSIDHNLLKLDILGHDDPTMIRMLEDITGVNAQKIPLDNKEVLALFEDTSSLGIGPDELMDCDLGSLGIPEFGTDFVMQMLRDTKPKNFSDLVRISGLSHGTDVWLNNAQYFIEQGNCTLSTAICTRDDIMTFLIHKGVDKGLAFDIMEAVRKGKVAKGKEKKWPEMEAAMKEAGIEDWYIESCKRIKYMFPKAHAVAYVMMAFRIAYFKVFFPQAYYAAYFSIRAKAFNYEKMCMGRDVLEKHMKEFKKNQKPSPKDVAEFGDMRIVQEMYARGFEFMPIDIYRAKASSFQVIDDKIMPALTAIDGMGASAAEGLVEAAKKGKFSSRENFRNRSKVNSTVTETMNRLGLLGNLPEKDQLSIFDFGDHLLL